MQLQRSVLVVDVDPEDLRSTVPLLRSAGYRVSTAAGFDEAKKQLSAEAPDLLITGVRLGSYNGLHLILRGRIDHPAMAAIVTTHFPDPVLEAEARRQHAEFLLRPVADGDLLDAVGRCLLNTAPADAPASTERVSGGEQIG